MFENLIQGLEVQNVKMFENLKQGVEVQNVKMFEKPDTRAGSIKCKNVLKT